METAVCLLSVHFPFPLFFFSPLFSFHGLWLLCRRQVVQGEDMQTPRGVLVCQCAVRTHERLNSHTALYIVFIYSSYNIQAYLKNGNICGQVQLSPVTKIIKDDFRVCLVFFSILYYPNAQSVCLHRDVEVCQVILSTLPKNYQHPTTCLRLYKVASTIVHWVTLICSWRRKGRDWSHTCHTLFSCIIIFR